MRIILNGLTRGLTCFIVLNIVVKMIIIITYNKYFADIFLRGIINELYSQSHHPKSRRMVGDCHFGAHAGAERMRKQSKPRSFR